MGLPHEMGRAPLDRDLENYFRQVERCQLLLGALLVFGCTFDLIADAANDKCDNVRDFRYGIARFMLAKSVFHFSAELDLCFDGSRPRKLRDRSVLPLSQPGSSLGRDRLPGSRGDRV